jgi:hydrocephalus-inducing protein
MLFPSLAFEPGTSLDFGSLLKHTELQRSLTVRNVGALPVEFEWQLLTTSRPVFDVYPLRGELAPGDCHEVIFTFFAVSDESFKKYSGTAICHLHGSRDYPIALTGSSADIRYKVVPGLIELGCQHYAATISAAMTLQNLSDVPFSFAVQVPRGCSFRAIDVRPASGKVSVNGSVSFSVTVQPGLPREYSEKFFIQIGHFDDAEVDVKVSCTLPQLALSLPRAKNDPVVNWLGEKGLEKPITEAEFEITSQRLLEKPDRKVGSTGLFDEKEIKAADGFVGYVASIHELDFGRIVLGESKQLSFSMRNVTTIPVSYELVTKTLEGTGFSCHLTSFHDIQPDEVVNATFSFNSEKHSIHQAGEVEYQILIAFSLELGCVVNIRANIMIPEILFLIDGRPFNFDDDKLEFEPTLLGQSRTLWIQVQNPTAVDVEYEISPIQSENVVQRNKLSQVFVCSLQSGVLPPTSFKNVEIMFAPLADRAYSVQFPIRVRYNEKLFFISIRGTGIMLKCYFDPPNLTFDPILPFSSPSYAEFAIVNPTSHPIEVYSPIFDFQNCCDLIRERYQAMYQVEEEVRVASPNIPSTIARLAFCVVVHGPRRSGKSVVSRTVAKILGNIPILSLRDLWNGAEESAFEENLQAAFHGSDCVSGFVVDGLDFFPEAPEIELALVHLLKQRTLVDELAKNPFLIVNQLSETACERALEHIQIGRAHV